MYVFEINVFDKKQVWKKQFGNQYQFCAKRNIFFDNKYYKKVQNICCQKINFL